MLGTGGSAAVSGESESGGAGSLVGRDKPLIGWAEGADSAESATSRAPQLAQNALSTRFDVPHTGQVTSEASLRTAPQLLQYLPPSRFCIPQFAQ